MTCPVCDTGIEPIELEEDEFLEGAVVVVKIARVDSSSITRAASPGLSHWEQLGMLMDATDHAREIKEWR